VQTWFSFILRAVLWLLLLGSWSQNGIKCISKQCPIFGLCSELFGLLWLVVRNINRSDVHSQKIFQRIISIFSRFYTNDNWTSTGLVSDLYDGTRHLNLRIHLISSVKSLDITPNCYRTISEAKSCFSRQWKSFYRLRVSKTFWLGARVFRWEYSVLMCLPYFGPVIRHSIQAMCTVFLRKKDFRLLKARIEFSSERRSRNHWFV